MIANARDRHLTMTTILEQS